MELSNQRRFHVRYCLGRGGFGEVYRATMESQGGLKTEVALKVLRLDLGPNAEAVRRLRDEGRLLAALDHPAILRAYDLAVLDGRVGLVTEFVNGEDLTQIVRGADVLPPRALVAVIGAVAEALHVAWTSPSPETGEPMRLVHRDIKPSNIRIGTHGEVKLLDFGIARSEQIDREAQTNAGSAVGSLPYMAPERFARGASAPPSDVYGLGCTLFEGLARRRLFPDAVPIEMFRFAAEHRTHFAHVQAALDTLELDPELGGLLAVMLSHEAAERPTAQEVALVCEDLAERLDGPTLKRWARDHRWPAAEAVAGLFEGRTLTEGTLETSPTAERRALGGTLSDSSATYALDLPAGSEDATRVYPTPERRRRVAIFGLGAVAFAAMGLVGFVGTDWRSWSDPDAATQVRAEIQPTVQPEAVLQEPVLAVEPETVEPESVEPEPVEPESVTPAPVVRPQPVAVAEPDPVTMESELEPVGTGTVTLATGGVKVELRSGNETYATGELPVGRYDLWADFGSGMLQRGRVDIVVGRDVTIRCNTLTYGCDVQD